uniref:Uncharacterized protein n=1 Tax=Phaeomonas parva TaxID=124430 RepID=A0A7S1UI34_9STRA
MDVTPRRAGAEGVRPLPPLPKALGQLRHAFVLQALLLFGFGGTMLIQPHLFVDTVDHSAKMFPTPSLLYRIFGVAVIAFGVGNWLCTSPDAMPETRRVVGTMTIVYALGTLVLSGIYGAIHPGAKHAPPLFLGYNVLQVLAVLMFGRELHFASREIAAKIM